MNHELQETLRPLCNRSVMCEPSVMLHDSYSVALEIDSQTGAWLVLDDTDPSLWAESYWPGELYTTLWPYSPSTTEGILVIVLAVCNALLTLGALRVVRRASIAGGWLRFA